MAAESSSLPPNSPAVFLDVTRDNLRAAAECVRTQLAQAVFVAVDAEFTGLGFDTSVARSKDPARSSNISVRYGALRDAVSDYSLVALGLSIFVDEPSRTNSLGRSCNPNGSSLSAASTLSSASASESASPSRSQSEIGSRYRVHNYHFSLLRQSPFKVSPDSLSFLAENDFDFSKYAKQGIPLFPGNDPTQEELKRRRDDINSANQLLPENLEAFVADLADMLPGGLVDTKYISDYVTRETTSFLSYLYRKYERLNYSRPDGYSALPFQCVLQTPQPLPPIADIYANQHTSRDTPSETGGKPYCEQYANHGVCRAGRSRCTKTHDLDVILDAEWNLSRSRAKSVTSPAASSRTDVDRRERIGDSVIELSGSDSAVSSAVRGDEISAGGHVSKSSKRKKEDGKDSQSARQHQKRSKVQVNASDSASGDKETRLSAGGDRGDDAHNEKADAGPGGRGAQSRTAVAGSNALVDPRDLPPPSSFHSAAFDAFMTGFVFAAQIARYGLATIKEKYANKIYLVGLDIPLRIAQSAFAKPSKCHKEKCARMRSALAI